MELAMALLDLVVIMKNKIGPSSSKQAIHVVYDRASLLVGVV